MPTRRFQNKEDDSLAAPSEPDKVKRTSDTVNLLPPYIAQNLILN